MEQSEYEAAYLKLRITCAENLKTTSGKIAAAIRLRDIEECYRLGHTVAGTSATYGFRVVAGLAQELAEEMKRALDSSASVSEERWRKWFDVALEIRSSCDDLASLQF